MSTEEKKLEDKIKELTKAIEALIALETTKLQNQTTTKETTTEEQIIDREALEAELKEHHLGELVSFAIKKDLIKRGTTFD